MDLITHLETSALKLFPPVNGQLGPEHGRYLESFRVEQRGPSTLHRLNLSNQEPQLVLRLCEWILRREQFDVGGGADYDFGTLAASLEQQYSGREGWLARVPRDRQELHITYRLDVRVDGKNPVLITTSRNLPSWIEALEAELRDLLARTPAELSRLLGDTAPLTQVPHNPIAPPGKPLEQPHSGHLLDYSGCAPAETLTGLGQGDLPLGRFAFGFTQTGVAYGPDLYLPRFENGDPMLYNGALICAPQNSGKTQLILRWAMAANRAGYNVFLIDVKGNLRRELVGRLKGRIYHFSTDPELDDCDGINFLAGLRGDTPEDGRRVRQLVAALLPREGWEAGEQAYFYQNHVNWMTGLIHILLLYRHYVPQEFLDGEVDLGHLYELASDEQQLYTLIENVRAMEAWSRPEKRIQPRLDYWTREIALLIESQRGGQRTAEYSYRTLTQSIVNALRPFSRFGTLYRKTSRGRPGAPLPERRFFKLEDLNEQREPVTILFAAREQDVDDAETVVSLVVKKLELLLFERMTLFDRQVKPEPRGVLLLLDETRRIRGFAPDEYITFARQARAGCVIVYQSLSQVGDEQKLQTILENVGTQIYLGSLTGETARQFLRLLPNRIRPRYTFTAARSQGHVEQAVQTGYDTIEYFSTAELHRLPAGRYPALVYLNHRSYPAPFLVDLDNRFDVSPSEATHE